MITKKFNFKNYDDMNIFPIMQRYYKRNQNCRILVLFLFFLYLNPAAAGISVVVQTGMSCPGIYGGGVTSHLSGAIGGFPTDGSGTSSLDEYSVGQGVWHYECDWGGFYWNCRWNKLYSEETLWEPPPNSYITNYESFFNTGFTQFTTAGTYGKGYYWSNNQQLEQWTTWEWASDHC
ncbi:MAG: hypothetical protein OEZ58_20140 [Gammaproteobacteria bacterium]|nr:hypothetical protein [Gammaproteobacteria bacterium]MDH5731302.1 hypothetical protein [Gammaproteobacteria bacterium]